MTSPTVTLTLLDAVLSFASSVSPLTTAGSSAAHGFTGFTHKDTRVLTGFCPLIRVCVLPFLPEALIWALTSIKDDRAACFQALCANHSFLSSPSLDPP